MIDYIKFSIDCNHEPLGQNYITKTCVTSLKSGKDNTTHGRFTGLDVKGKHLSNIKIRTLGDIENNKIEIEGNPAKFLQGHNLFGINDPVRLINLTFKQLVDSGLGLAPTQTQQECINNGFVRMTKIDINRNFHLPSKIEADRWIMEANDGMSMSHYGHVKQYNSTLYFGKGSKTKELKFYAKGSEIINNKSLPKSIQTPQMLEFANKMLRFEIRLNSKWLCDKELNYASNWNDRLVESLLDQSLARIKLSGNMRISDKILLDLKPTLIGTYQRWVDGHCLKNCLNPSTFYRHKRELLKYGIDISIELPKFNNPTLDLTKVLINNTVGIPRWAYEQGLVAI